MMSSLWATATRDDDGLIEVVCTDGAATLLIQSLVDGHPEGLDIILGGIAGAIRLDLLVVYFEESGEFAQVEIDIPQLTSLFERRLRNVWHHGMKRGPLLPVIEEEDRLRFWLSPSEFFLMTSQIDPDEFEESPQHEFLEKFYNAGMELVQPHEQMSIFHHTAETTHA